MRLFRPDALRLVLLTAFLLIAFFGWREAAAFSGGNAPSTAFWTAWMALLAPLGLLVAGLGKAGLPFDLFRAPPPVFWLVQIVWFYALACATSWLARALSRRIRPASPS